MTDITANTSYERTITIPNLFTFLRLLACPALVFVCIVWWSADYGKSYVRDALVIGIYATACLFDFADGYIARKWNQKSRLGEVWDPIADKALVLTAVGVALWTTHLSTIAFVFIGIILWREIAVTFARHVFKVGEDIPVSLSGKWKAFIQMIAAGFLLLNNGRIALEFDSLFFVSSFELLSTTILAIAMVLTVISGIGYARIAFGGGGRKRAIVSIVSSFVISCFFMVLLW